MEMTINLPLDAMSVAEKLQAMEAIWSSLCTTPYDLESPDWHRDVLAERKQRLESGDATISDWTEAKKRLQDLGQ